MSPADFLVICGTGFIAVFVLLSFLALLMHLLVALFPPVPVTKDDPYTIAAINVVMNTIYPGTRVTKIENKK
jgi:hypothetical protein